MNGRKARINEIDVISLPNVEIPVHIHYEYRRGSRVAIGKNRVIMRIPTFLSKEDKIIQINDFKKWAEKKFLQRPQLLPFNKRKEFYSGKVICARERSFILFLEFTKASSSRIQRIEEKIIVRLSSKCSEDEMEKIITRGVSEILANEFAAWMEARLAFLNELHFPQKIFKTFKLKYMQSLWGNCSFDGKIQISTRLLFAPDEVIDYVLIHELAHLLVQDHSKKFWTLVQQAMPHYKNCVNWLKEHGDECDF